MGMVAIRTVQTSAGSCEDRRQIDSWRVRRWRYSIIGAAVVTVYKRADGTSNEAVADGDVRQKTWVRYTPAVEARGFTREQVDKVDL